MKRPPIVVVLGHVDHGKTTLLDYIRKTNVAGKEAGGITQAIGAYEIVHNGKKITFVDTPGHEAFSKMRARGARVADLAILVVAADDGVQPQTKDALTHIQNAKIPFLVAVNKIDKPNADADKVKQALAEAGVFVEGYGGNVSWQAISAKTGQGVNELLDLIILAAELENLEYDPAGRTEGIVLTARTDSRRGNIVTAVVENGKLKVGQAVATATAAGKIKALENFLGERVNELEPSAPAVIYGFEDLPQVGEEFFAGEGKVTLIEASRQGERPKVSLITNGNKLILRAEEAGALEALEGLIEKLTPELTLVVVDAGVGNVYENDVKLAATTGATIIGFRVKVDRAAENLAVGQNVRIISSDIIYDLEKNLREHFRQSGGAAKGELTVLAVFGERKGKQQIIGGRITAGEVKNKDSFEVRRQSEAVGEGRIINLQSQRKDILRAGAGQEVGLLVENEVPIAVGDVLLFK